MTTTHNEGEMTTMFGSRTKDAEPEAPAAPTGYVPLPADVVEKAVPGLVELARRGSVMLDGVLPRWTVTSSGRLSGPPHLLFMARPREAPELTVDHVFVIDVGDPFRGTDPAGLEAHMRRQLGGCYVRQVRDGEPLCWQVGQPFPEPEPVVEVAPPPPPKPILGLHLGAPLSEHTRQVLKMQIGGSFRQAESHMTVRWENPDPDGKLDPSQPPGPAWYETPVARPSFEGAYNPRSGVCVGTTMDWETNDRRNFLICWPTHLPIGDADMDRVRVDEDGGVRWCVWPGEPDLPFANARMVRCVRVDS